MGVVQLNPMAGAQIIEREIVRWGLLSLANQRLHLSFVGSSPLAYLESRQKGAGQPCLSCRGISVAR